MEVTKPTDLSILLTRSFPASRQKLFDALTQRDQVLMWYQSARMPLVQYEADLRAGGHFRYVFQRASGARMEMRGVFQEIDSPYRWVYRETYDFSQLELLVTTMLEEVQGETIFRQTVDYPSQEQRDGDFDGVAASAADLYEKLARYLE